MELLNDRGVPYGGMLGKMSAVRNFVGEFCRGTMHGLKLLMYTITHISTVYYAEI